MASHYFPSHRGGVEIIAEHLFRGLTSQGQTLTWAAGDASPAPDPIGASHAVGLPVFNFVEDKTGLPFPVPTLGAIRRLRVETRHADVLVLHDCLYLTNICAFFFAKMRRVPTIIIQHIGIVPYKNFMPRFLMKFANLIITRPMLSRAEQVVFYSEITKNYFKGLSFKRAPEMILNGVDTDMYRTLGHGETKAAVRSQYGLPNDRPVILFVGRFVEKKGIPIFKHMATQRPDWLWVFAGWGPLDPTSWHLSNVQVFSQLRDSALAPLYRASDVLVLPSTGEGFPLVIQEALSSGLPVLSSTETVAANEDMKSKAFVRGAPLNPNDDKQSADDFLAVLDQLIGSITAPELNPAQIREYAVSQYSWRNALQQYSQVISQLAPTSTGARALREDLGIQ